MNLFKSQRTIKCAIQKKDAHIKDYRKKSKINVILDVGSVHNALHELRSSGLDLQGQNLKLNRANKT